MQKLLLPTLVFLTLSSAVYASSDCASNETSVTVNVETAMPLSVLKEDGTSDMLFQKNVKTYCYKEGATATVSYLNFSSLSGVDEFMNIFDGESWTTSMTYHVTEPLTITSSSLDGISVSVSCSTDSGRDCAHA